MDTLALITDFGVMALAIAAIAVIAHYRRERRRAALMRHLDHHDWCRW